MAEKTDETAENERLRARVAELESEKITFHGHSVWADQDQVLNDRIAELEAVLREVLPYFAESQEALAEEYSYSVENEPDWKILLRARKVLGGRDGD